MRFGVREICDVVLRAKATQYLGTKKFYKDEPVLYFDTLKTSTLEGASTTVYATGGRGNVRLVAWEGERTVTFTMEDALISPESFSILSGAGLIAATNDAPIYVHRTYQYEVKEPNTIVLKEEACWNKYNDEDPLWHNGADIFVMTMTDGQIDSEPCVPAAVAADHKTITCYSHSGTIDKGDVVLVDYYVKQTGGAQTIRITADKFGGNYYLEASTLFRDEQSGVDMPAEFIIPNCKVQSNFTFSMASSGDPSTFTFTMDAFPDYTKFNKTEKVFADIQVITEAVETKEESRIACVKQDVKSLTDGVTITFDNDSTEDNCKLTVTGSNVDGTAYDQNWWGDKLNAAAEVEIVMPIDQNGSYRLVTQNPMLKNYPDDATLKNGVWTKDVVYDIDDGSLTLRTAITDDKGSILIKLFRVLDSEGNIVTKYEESNKNKYKEELVKTFSINNKVSFQKKEDAVRAGE